MNKELILKYIEEFNYWLNDGDIIVTFTNNGWVNHLSFDWCSKDLDCDIKHIVINDEYVEFRKALAEGKTIQCNAREGQNEITYNAFGHNWLVDVTEFKYATSFYRIKPEEPQSDSENE